MFYNLKIAIAEEYGSQLAFAVAAKIHPVRLNKIVNGWIEVMPAERARLAALLDADTAWLFANGARIPRPEPRTIHSGATILAAS